MSDQTTGRLDSLRDALGQGVSLIGVSLPEVTLLLGVSAVAVTFELGAGAAVASVVSVEVETLTFVGAGGAHPKIKVIARAATVA